MLQSYLETFRRMGVHFDVQVIATENSVQVLVRRGPALHRVPVDFGYYVKSGPKGAKFKAESNEHLAVVQISGIRCTLPVIIKPIIKHKRRKALRARIAVVQESGRTMIHVLVPRHSHVDVIRQVTTVQRAEVPVEVAFEVPADLADLFADAGHSGAETNGKAASNGHQGNGSANGQSTNGKAATNGHAGNGQPKKKATKERGPRRNPIHS